MAQEKLQLVIQAEDKASKEIDNVSKSVDAMSTASKWAAAAAAALATGVAYAGKKAIEAAADFQQTQIAFTTMLGSADAAAVMLEDLAKFAARTPFELKDVENNARLLMAMGIETDKILPTMKALGDVSAGLSVPIERIALNFGQVKTQTKLTGVELRDFLRAGVPLLAELATNLGTTESNIKDMVTAGQIGFEDVEKAFITMTSEGGKFNNLMDAQSKTFNGAVSNMKDQVDLFLRSAGQPFLETGTKIIQKITGMIEEFTEAGSIVEVFREKITELLDYIDGKTYLVTILENAFNMVSLVFTEHLLPALKELWDALQPLMPFLQELAKVFGVMLLGALIGVVTAITTGLIVAVEALTVIIKGISLAIKEWVEFIDGLIADFEKLWNWLTKIESKLHIFDTLKGIGTAWKNLPANLGFGGGMATGGEVSSNNAYVVGEQGAEVFVPSSAGRIIPNSGLGGNTFNLHITGTFLSEDAAEAMGNLLVNKLASQGVKL